ncbi:hypothetical protein GOP47_0001170 [Adiantum capillus-veneris]|uniref:Pentatricopeptide repeat-containing protein n=1 Tax=Adiantum capillus-veneris TaxID=13818 RepID=A0A9D4ZSY8_ADICA|nr:hypothetical protein GOP47_0001170 [Adiantum capillus-veneris]
MLGTTLVDMYAKCGRARNPWAAFNKCEAIESLQMQSPMLSSRRHVTLCKTLIRKFTMVSLVRALLVMYAKYGVLQKAQKLLEELLVQDVNSWNVLLTRYVVQGMARKLWVVSGRCKVKASLRMKSPMLWSSRQCLHIELITQGLCAWQCLDSQ